MFYRTPDGLAETMANEIGSAIGWAAFNVGDGDGWRRWSVVGQRSLNHGVRPYLWQRCRNPDGLRHLLEQGRDSVLPVLPNVEQELEGDLPSDVLGSIISEYPGVEIVGYSCLGWLQNSVDFSPMTNKPVLLQLFPTDMRRDPAELPRIQRDCVSHARDLGFRFVGVTNQTYGAARPSWYDYQDHAVSFYTADDIGHNGWSAWAP